MGKMSELHADASQVIADLYLGHLTTATAFEALLALGLNVDDAHFMIDDANAYHCDYYGDEVHVADDDVA